MDDILFFGDPHGDITSLDRAVAAQRPAAVVVLGDFGVDAPLQDVLADTMAMVEGRLWWIHGNHDTDGVENFDHTLGSALAGRNLSGRVETICGRRVAGLGGVFRGQVWNPRAGEPRIPSRDAFKRTLSRNGAFRGGVPLKHRSTIFPEDLETLRAAGGCDILVSHEAPNCIDEMGFSVLDDLAAQMGAVAIIHGHHHRSYSARLGNGIPVRGVGLAEPVLLSSILPFVRSDESLTG